MNLGQTAEIRKNWAEYGLGGPRKIIKPLLEVAAGH